jgi:hypothetical protein
MRSVLLPLGLLLGSRAWSAVVEVVVRVDARWLSLAARGQLHHPF